MTEKVLGKIVSAEYGKVKDYPYLFGLILKFQIQRGFVCCGGKYTVNFSDKCKYEDGQKEKAIIDSVEFVNTILTDAKVLCVSELVNKPVEITLDGHLFKDFRILTEVL